MNGLRRLASKLLNDQFLGALDYYRFPEQRNNWGGALNGQKGRQLIVREILGVMPLEYIVETGTFRGATTEFFNTNTNLPVYSVEAVTRTLGFARMRLLGQKRVNLSHGDSRKFLQKLVNNPDINNKSGFFYLDAHWEQDLPLNEELQIIFGSFTSPIVMIDDFQVMDDEGYRYDDYGSGKCLSLDYIQKIVKDHNLVMYYPVLNSEQETSARRGCIALVHQAEAEKLNQMKLLRQYE